MNQQTPAITAEEIRREMDRWLILTEIREFAREHGASAAHQLIDDAAMALNEEWCRDQRVESQRAISAMQRSLLMSGVSPVFVAGMGVSAR